ncbi:MAG: TetR family transcriptional regulator [Streptosporangiaceae bacterium]
MQARHDPGSSPKRTFTETARRAQIVEAAIATIAEVGYRGASFTQIAKRAGLSSTGLISYHFAGKDELIEEVVADIVGAIGRFMAGRLQAVPGARAALRAYIEGNVEFTGAHRREMKALVDIFMNGGFHYDTATEEAVVSPVEDILRAGQQAGEFRRFDPKVMATLVQRAVDGLPFLLAGDPDLDVSLYAAEVAAAFDLATRAER